VTLSAQLTGDIVVDNVTAAVNLDGPQLCTLTTTTSTTCSSTRTNLAPGTHTLSWSCTATGVGGNGSNSGSQQFVVTGPSGNVFPKYLILSVVYAPPGQKSTVDYGGSTAFGTTSSLDQSFSNTNTLTVSIKAGTDKIPVLGGSITASTTDSFTQASDTISTMAINKGTSLDLQVAGPASSADGIDHDFDIIYLWVNPAVNLTQTGANALQWSGYSFDPGDPANEVDVVPVFVTWLKHPETIPPGVADVLARTWAGPGRGITTADFADILKADPFANGSTNIDPARFFFPTQGGQTFSYEPAPAGGQPQTEKLSLTYSSTDTQGLTSTDTHSIGFTLGVTSSFLSPLLATTVQDSSTLVWTNKTSTQTSRATGQTASLSLTGPASAYTGPTDVQVYTDNIYGTFMFAFVPNPTFDLSVNAGTQTVNTGNTASYAISTSAVNGFTGSVLLGASGLSVPGATASFSINPIAGAGNSIMTVTTSSTTPSGTYTVNVSGTSNLDIRNLPLTLIVVPPADFSLTATPSSQTAVAGSSSTFTVSTGSLNGFTGNETLAVAGLPAGVTATVSPNPILGAGTSTLTVNLPANVVAGNYPITITGTSGVLSHTVQVNLSITAPDFTISATPTSGTVTAGGNTTYIISTAALNGFIGSVGLGTSGLPTGATASFSPASISGSASSTLTVATSSSTPAATYTITITGISGSIVHSTAVLLAVNAATGSVSITAPSNNSNQSTSVRVTASATEPGIQIAQMQVWDNTTGIRLGINNGSTIDQTYTLATGTHQIIVEDLAPVTFAVLHTSTVNITVFADGVHITAPANNASITGPVRVTGFATESSAQIAQIQVWDNTTGVRLGINNGSSIDQTYTLPAGAHQIIMEDLAAGTFAVLHTSSVNITVH
jgi:hypothetical protein